MVFRQWICVEIPSIDIYNSTPETHGCGGLCGCLCREISDIPILLVVLVIEKTDKLKSVYRKIKQEEQLFSKWKDKLAEQNLDTKIYNQDRGGKHAHSFLVFPLNS